MQPVIRILWRREIHFADRPEAPTGGVLDGWTSGWSVLGTKVEVVVETISSRSGPTYEPRLLRVEKTEAGFALYVSGSSREAVRAHIGPVILALAAQLQQWVALRGRLMPTPGDTEKAVLVFGAETAPGFTESAGDSTSVLVDAASLPSRALESSAHLPGGACPERAGATFEVTAIAIIAAGEGLQYLDPKAASAYIGSRLFTLDALIAAQNGALIFSTLRRLDHLGIHQLIAGVPAFHVPRELLRAGQELPDLPRAPAGYSEDTLEAIRSMQLRASAVYGYSEPDRAIVWALEEMGELAQAIRRRESPSRITEEIGQLFNWLLCLANICEVDLATAADQAVGREGFRQLTTHGGLRPRTRSEPFRSRT
ncbi:MazG nucleotide pyrophosphohydrolase domain-containing protein [Nocardia asiatica]|uniref:MazG nucleotide pyrophosphohydrolase domain-containing protein n=1 Tax=Nocardia asiatica TaxID=209252 RepID=UPI0002DAB34F|nr:MazG nucleotide pyrophosphohydrolase domain-containing protein [Nocardia asiatica]